MSLLSVVVPVYDVEEYLDAALGSLANQTHRDIEVVMVDDGSTDRSAEIAARYAETDTRFRLVQQENHGLGHARNTGTRHATGEFLTFVDSDDLVPHYACRMAVRTLQETGSDFLSGNEYRYDSRGAHPAPMLESNFAVTQLRTNVGRRPTLMRDLLPHNKVYRRAFWDAAELAFPEGILFEDGPVSVRAHARAKAVDVVATPLYYWRLRESAQRSLTQLYEDERFFVDRIYASTLSADFLEAHRPDLVADFYRWDIRHKFPVMYKSLPAAPRPVQEAFMRSAVPHLCRASSDVVKSLPPGLRRRVEVTRDGDLAALLDLLPAAASKQPVPAPVDASPRRRARALLAQVPGARAVRAYARLTSSAASVRSAVFALGRRADRVYLRGYAYLLGLPAEGHLTAGNRVLWARHQETRRLVRLRLRSVPSEEATALAQDASWTYRRAGFEATLPMRHLRDHNGRWQYGNWVLALGALTARGVARGGLRIGPEAYRADPAPIDLGDGARLVPVVINGVLNLRLEPTEVTLEDCRLDGPRLVLTGRLTTGVTTPDASLLLGRVPGVPEVAAPAEWLADSGTSRFRATVPLSDVVNAVTPVAAVPIAGHPDRLGVTLRLRRGELSPHPLACPADFPGLTTVVAGHRVTVQSSTDGNLAVTVRAAGPVVESAGWTEAGELWLRGSGADPAGQVRQFQLVGRHSGYREQRILPSQVNPDGTWEGRFHPERVPQTGAVTALRAGAWRLALRTRVGGGQIDTDLPYTPAVFAGVEQFRIIHSDRYALKRVGLDGLSLRINSRLRPAERSGYGSRRLREQVYPALRRRARLREAVLYSSFNGKQFSDSPRAVHEELLARGAGLAHTWVTRDAQAPVPDGVATVEANSREWFEALATSRYVVDNTHLPAWFRRREDQVVAQTWHGIGFKRVAFDMDAVHFANRTYLEKLLQEAPNWSFLVSPSRFCTEIMRRAFRYDGEVCEIGSPRNDLLISGDRTVISEQVRRDLGLPPERKVILYAPTWRDDQFHGPGRYKFHMQLDAAQFPEDLRRDHVLLVRRHPNTVDDLLGYDREFVFDVANYPDARELLVLADVLITDYSTIALDFVNTGRPILFYTYDLANYRDNLRGFYFDLEGEGPGPVLETTAEVVDALRDLDAVSERYRDRYQHFHEVFCHAEDGHATARLVDRLLRDA